MNFDDVFEVNLVGRLRILKDMGMKVNYSALSRTYGIDRHTIAKIYKNDGVPLRRGRPSKSSWDPYEQLIQEKINLPGATNKGVFMFLKHTLEVLPGTYSGFCDYLRRNGIRHKAGVVPHVLYETIPGEQLQGDWKEDITLHLKDGSEVKFNVFSATLGYSREHIFLLSMTKTEDDLIRCVLETYRKLGGVTKKFKTDNMSAIVSVRGKNKTLHPRITQFFKDLDVQLELCEVKTPQTKGKDENANKFMNWLIPYDGELSSLDELRTLIEDTITADTNRQINTGTQLPPMTLFEKEKEYLKPLNNKVLLESYLQEHLRPTIDDTLLFYYKGNKYSVPASCIDETVDIYPIDGSLYVFLNKKLVTIQTITQNRVNYEEGHYTEALKIRLNKYYDNDEIEEMAKANLERLRTHGKYDD